MMAVSIAMLPAILSSLLCLSHSTPLISPVASSERSSPNHDLIREMDDAKLKIARLESVLEEVVQDLNAKSLYLKERKKLIEEMGHKIDHLQSALSSFKDDSSRVYERIDLLEEEVKLLWEVSRRNNFELHNLESKAQDAERRLEMVTSQVEKMADVVTEQWIQIQQLEQGLQIAEKKIWKVKRQITSGKCTWLKYVRTLFDHTLQISRKMVGVISFKRGSTSGYMDQALQYLKGILSAAKKYHHELQGFIKMEMERSELTAAFANEEVVFFMASALIIFPLMSAWMLLSSQFSS